MTTPFSEWESFYVIVGSSAGALTGLQFVVIALIAESRSRPTPDQIGAFGTPTIVHFSVVLLLSAVVSSPWPSFTGPALLLGTVGAIGIGYVAVITARAGKQQEYKPVFEDWLWHNILPFVAYGLLLSGSLLLARRPTVALFMMGAMSLILLFVGIHNAWDTVTFIVVRDSHAKTKDAANTKASEVTKGAEQSAAD